MRYLKFVAPIALVVIIDLIFQFGAWEPIASPESHAGMSITKKRALADPEFQHIDFVSLGSSRPAYGVDHAAFAKAAAAHNFVYANLTVAGTHWMTIGVLVHWLAVHHPEIRGGVIALSVQDFLASGNGAYEIGIVYPFRELADIGSMARHVPFDWHDAATFGLYSGLFEYHEDVQDLLLHPQHRSDLLDYFRSLTPGRVLMENVDETADMCAAPINTLQDCSALSSRGSKDDPKILRQCEQLEATARNRFDLRPILDGQSSDERLQKTSDQIREQLRQISWPTPPVFVLMPMPSVWASDVVPQGTHAWALSVLQPLVAQGKIRVLDYTDMFGRDGGPECKAFFDLYHNNVTGRQRVMERLLPELEHQLFAAQNTSRPTQIAHAPQLSH